MITFDDSALLLKCFGFALRENDSGNLDHGRDCLVLPPKINRIAENFPNKVIVKVHVMLLPSVEPAIDTELEPFFAKFCPPTVVYFKDLWLRLRMRQDSTLCFSALVAMP